MSQITKNALAASLKKLLETKPLDKITVVDIVEDCGVNRQTFYYHFQDIYDLADWFLVKEISKALQGHNTYDTWQQGFLQIFEWVQSNKQLILNTYRCRSRERIETFLYDRTYQLLIDVVEEQAAGMPVRAEDKEFLANFYKFAFVGLMLEWIRSGMRENPEDIVARLSVLLKGDFSRALKKYCAN